MIVNNFFVALCSSSVDLCVNKETRTYTEKQREAQSYTEIINIICNYIINMKPTYF